MIKLTKIWIGGLLAISVSALTTTSNAQVTTIDYSAWSTNQCNAFANSPTINGITHRTEYGQPIKSSNGLTMQFDQQTWDKGTAMTLSYTFLANHTYRIAVEAALQDPLELGGVHIGTYNMTATTKNACNGPEYIPSGFYTSRTMSGTGFDWYDYDVVIGSQNMNTLLLIFRNGQSGYGTSTIKNIYVRKVTIQDLTPIFNLEATTTTKYCSEEKEVTYTITNPGNTAGVTGYRFELIGGDWLYPNGMPAPSVINSSTNSVTLISGPCAQNATIKGYALIGSTVVQTTNGKLLSTLIPTIAISGPDNLTPNNSGFYQASVSSAYLVNHNWLCQVSPQFTWSTNLPNETIMYNTTPTSTYFYTHNNFLAASPFGRGVQLMATTTLCGGVLTATKDIWVSPGFAPINGTVGANIFNESIQGLSIYPNPAKDHITIEFEKDKGDYRIELYAFDGKLLQETSAHTPKIEFEITKYPAGIYFIKATSNGKTQMKKFTKN